MIRSLRPPTAHEIEIATVRNEAKLERRRLSEEWRRRTNPWLANVDGDLTTS
jgi:hypothetical protein